MKLPDAVFQLDDLIVPRLDLIHRLLGDVVHNDLRGYDRGRQLQTGTYTHVRSGCTRRDTHPRGKDGWVVALQHALQLLICCVSAS